FAAGHVQRPGKKLGSQTLTDACRQSTLPLEGIGMDRPGKGYIWKAELAKKATMSTSNDSGLLELLRGKDTGANAVAALAARPPAHEPAAVVDSSDAALNEVLNRITQLTGANVRRGESPEASPAAPSRLESAPAAYAVSAAANRESSKAIESVDEFI